MKKQIGAAFGLTALVCVGIWLYVESDIKQFKTSLTEVPTRQTESHIPSAVMHGENETSVPVVTVPSKHDSGTNTLSPGAAERTPPVAVQDVRASEVDLDSFLDDFYEELQTDTIPSEDTPDVSKEGPYDEALVTAGFDDYNAYLQSDPEYAYQRLDEAFREQYGDDPDVGIIVETVRRSNESSVTIDDAIYHTEAMIRLVSKISPPEAVAVITDHLEYLTESKQLALESGDGVEPQFNFRFHVGE